VDDVTERLARLEPGSMFAGYRIERILDRGGMGLVYKAADVELERTVALKIIAPEHTQNPDAVTRFKSEARLAASLEHPNIVPIHRGGEYHGVLYLAMRFVPGTNLRQVIDRGQLSLDQVQRVVHCVASALDAAHERGLVHRDVKPANILISGEAPNEQIYLTDFGLTKKLGSPASLTRTGAWVGTPDYVAPEQIQGGAVDGRTDVYSLGCVLYETLTGSVAYPKDNDMAKLWAHVQDPPPSPSLKRPELVEAFDEVVSRATAKDPGDRYAKASDLADAVDRAVAEQSAALGPDAVDATGAAGAAPSAGEHDVFVPGPTRGSAPKAREPEPPPTPPSAGDDEPSAAPAAPSRRGASSRVVLAAAAGLVVVLGVLGAVLLAGGGDGSDEDGQAPRPAAAAPVATKLPSDLAWRPIASPPFQRQYAAATAVDGKVMVIGGIGVRESSTTTKIYDPGSGSWTTEAGLPAPLHHASAVTYEGEAVVIGGFIPGDELTSEQSDRVYALRGGSWEELPSLNHPRAAAAAAVVGDKIVVVGGQADGKLVRQTEVFDGESWTDVAEMPTPREHLAAASDGRYLYAVGGRELSADKNSTAIERYDPADDSWTELDGMPQAAGGLSAAYAGGRVIAIGGEGTTAASDAVQAYDIRDESWSRLPALPRARHGIAVAAVDDAVYSIGGATAAGHLGSTKEAEVLDLSGKPAAAQGTANREWRALAGAPSKREYAASTEIAGRLWLFGGIDADERASTETAVYDRAINIWASGPELPRPLHHAAAVTWRGDAVLIGGFAPGVELTSGQSSRVYVMRGDSWEELPPLNHPRAAAAAAVVGGKIVVVGGQADQRLVRQTEVFDGREWTVANDIPTPREHLGAASDGRYLYAVGGRDLSADKNVPALERYDPADDSWTKLDDLPKNVGSVGAAYVDGLVVAVGGEGVTEPFDAVQAFDVQSKRWSQLPALPAARHGAAVAVLGDSLYAIGGAAAAGHVQATDTVSVLDFD
jgi:serine/threonine protein kinase/N-acetylneuraminic acid mutarotase